MKKVSFLFVLIALFQSCQYFEKNVPNKEELLQKELKKINWEEVDEFPTTLACDSITDKVQRKQCFFDFMTTELQLKLTNDTIRSYYKGLDTLNVKVKVLSNAQISFQTHFKTDSLLFNRTAADSVLQSKLINFPSVEPAIKRGMKVKSEFVIPVYIKAKK
ncbi:hypothetical protein EQG63_10460 [Flavobacterium amnicola]|uniref:Uncharacterized protein n=1 Tax=Flavobacterium amnicola TaxID=2506422 RepID=A0A4Q1K1R9_9FLAO|nr:hypothetical protein [Flavobacterium amnicola]RXR17896.1 hypothetical protein EQG63_10460 [Flavobacterium amnicola]